MTPLRLAVLSLVRRKMATAITIASIAVSVGCSGTLLRLYRLSASRFSSLGRGWEAVVGAKAGGIEILLNSLNGEGPYPGFLPYNLYETLHAAQTVRFEDGTSSDSNFVKSVSPFLYFARFRGFRVVGTDDSFLTTVVGSSDPMLAGRWGQGESDLVAGDGVMNQEKLSIGDKVKVRTWIGDEQQQVELEMIVSGHLRPTGTAWDRMLFASLPAAHKAMAGLDLSDLSIWGTHVLNYFFVNLNPNGFSPLRDLINKRSVGQVIRVSDEINRLDELTGVGKSLGLYVSFFVLLLSGLSVSSMLITRFEAMTVQLAVLRAIGYGRGEVARWLLWEGLLLGVSGCLVGIAIDGCGFPLIRNLLGSALPPPEVTQVPLGESWQVWLLTLLATVTAVTIPLTRLYRQDVHSSLKT